MYAICCLLSLRACWWSRYAPAPAPFSFTGLHLRAKLASSLRGEGGAARNSDRRMGLDASQRAQGSGGGGGDGKG